MSSRETSKESIFEEEEIEEEFSNLSEDGDSTELDFASLSLSPLQSRQISFIQKNPITSSLFDNGYSCIYFPNLNETLEDIRSKLLEGMRWKVSSYTPKIVKHVVTAAGFELITKGKYWVGIWAKHPSNSDRFKKMERFQRINHFPSSFELGRKDRLYLAFTKKRETFGDKLFDYMPNSYLLPLQSKRLAEVFSSSRTWILKPPANARANGIKLVSNIADIPDQKDWIISKYIRNPLLINGRKFDLRVYVLVTSIEPLRCYVHKNGVVRFASVDYTNNSETLKNRFIHLTNYSINKKNKNLGPGDCSKWSFEDLRKHFDANNINYDKIFTEINKIVIKTISSAYTSNVDGCRSFVPFKDSCFELYGFDILIDNNLKPWLLEVNISPALKCTSIDYDIKRKLVVDIFNTVGIKIKDVKLCRDARSKKNISKTVRPMAVTSIKSKSKVIQFLNQLQRGDLEIIQEFEDERHRKGEFQLVFPSQNLKNYTTFGKTITRLDQVLKDWMQICKLNPDEHLADLIYFSKARN